ncbi:helix-turn-helix domain-containing protein [Pseudomonas syringae]|uniref:helix-turn-helix domain-containing protein n=1 Tax=Pseudomonas syringae TaxID=317 RepID=UPI0006E68ACA|nr:helix-turn-helix transcriptional regulator [Pseudomonas syringae]KPY52147.1 Cro/CI family transcriptional regulator [Pseudomonas syringae pv. rhaphiolepidis]KWS32315.1 Cro/Cl family transcriptional regulator [Pseudomonas syringae pv. rhaphiolepidis]
MARAEIGKALRLYRKQAGLTQAEFGELTGFDPKTISRLETGDRTPSLDALDTFAQVLKINVRDFFVAPKTELTEDEIRAYLFNAICKADKQALSKLKSVVDKVLLPKIS